jgi:hypothetical protein
MSIIRKTIGGRDYVYLVFREGDRVVQKYLGPAGSPKVARILTAKMEIAGVPQRLYPLFWDTNPVKINLRRNARYVIERVLELGDMDAVSWLQRVYAGEKIIDVLNMSRALSDKSRLFWKL